MLTDEERREIEAEIGRFPDKRAASIEALKIVQHHRGWVSDETLSGVADLLGMSSSDLDGIATFYNLIFRQPVGRHIILFCNSVSCWVMGYERVVVALTRMLGIGQGQTTADGRFTLLPNVCLGVCDHAPALMIDEELYRDVEPAQLDSILAPYR